MLPKVHYVIHIQEDICARAFLNQSNVHHSSTVSLLRFFFSLFLANRYLALVHARLMHFVTDPLIIFKSPSPRTQKLSNCTDSYLQYFLLIQKKNLISPSPKLYSSCARPHNFKYGGFWLSYRSGDKHICFQF